MKFKSAIIALLTAILGVSTIMAYNVISEERKQTQLQLAQNKTLFTIIEMSDAEIKWRRIDDGTYIADIYKIIYNEDTKGYDFTYAPEQGYKEAQCIVAKIEDN